MTTVLAIKLLVYNILYHPLSTIKDVFPFLFRTHPLILLFGSPYHCNMGDQTQTVCIQQWLRRNYPRCKVLTYQLRSSNDHLFYKLKLFLRKNDHLVCHSGYHMTDLYNEKSAYMSLARLFPNHHITIFPQTVNFLDLQELQKTADCFNSHGNVKLMCRDEESYNVAKRYFTNCDLLLMPDIVTSLIGTKHYNNDRKGILFCLRNDIEAYYKKEQISLLMDKFQGTHTETTDTTIVADVDDLCNNRERYLNELLDQYSRYKVVITDRYHGTIFSLIAGTPVVVLGSTDHKLSSGVKWFPKEFSDYVSFANDLDEAFFQAKEKLERNDLSYLLPPYFKEKYYDKMSVL